MLLLVWCVAGAGASGAVGAGPEQGSCFCWCGVLLVLGRVVQAVQDLSRRALQLEAERDALKGGIAKRDQALMLLRAELAEGLPHAERATDTRQVPPPTHPTPSPQDWPHAPPSSPRWPPSGVPLLPPKSGPTRAPSFTRPHAPSSLHTGLLNVLLGSPWPPRRLSWCPQRPWCHCGQSVSMPCQAGPHGTPWPRGTGAACASLGRCYENAWLQYAHVP